MIGEGMVIVFRALFKQGWSKSRLAREFGVNWRTVDAYVSGGEGPVYEPRACPAGL